MGIENLLNFIKPALTEQSITHYRGKTAAVDAMSWLYRGCYSCAYELNQDIKTNDYIYYIQKMLMMLREYDIKPILIFDGRKLKAKEKTEQIRKQIKGQNLAKGKEFMTAGNQTEAKKYFQRCLKITKQMLYTTFDVLRELEVQYIVAPYEADSQIAHLCLTGQSDFAITEDSDLICYKCPLIVFKLQSDGSCLELQLEKLRESKQNRAHIKDEDVRQFFAFSDEQLVDVCIMSGCDYVPSVRGIGIKKAINFVNKYVDLNRTIAKLKQNKVFKDKIPAEYERVIRATRLIFQFQTVYDLTSQKWIQLNQVQFDELMSNIENEPLIPVNQIHQLIGEKIDKEQEIQFCSGDLDVKTLKKRERMKIDFVQLFKRIERRLQNSQQAITDIQVKQKVAEFLQNDGLEHLPEFIDQPIQQLKEYVPTKRIQQQDETDIFKLCEELFDQQDRAKNVDDLEVISDDEEKQINIVDLTAEKTQQQHIILSTLSPSGEESSSEQFNPFAHKSQVKNTQCLSQIKSNHLIDHSTEKKKEPKKTVEKILKQTQSTIFSFVKK